MASLSSVLSNIRQNESGGNYAAQNPNSTASGAYQFINSTWQSNAAAIGVSTSQYPTAKSAPANVQDAVAAHALTSNGGNANSCSLWGTCDAAGNVTGPARYAQVDNYDTNSQTLLASGSLGNTGDSAGGFGSNGADPFTVTPGTGNCSAGWTATASGDCVPVTSGTGAGSGTSPTGSPSGGSQAGLGAGADIGYTPPAATGGPQTTGLAPGTVTSIGGWVNSVETAVGNWATTWAKNLFGSIANWFARIGLIVLGIILLAIALWRLMDPDGTKTKAAAEAMAA